MKTKQFIEGEPTTKLDFKIESLIMSQADDIAEKLTDLECKLNGITCWNTEMIDGVLNQSYTEEAQDIFNIYFDEQVTLLYALLNTQLTEINKK